MTEPWVEVTTGAQVAEAVILPWVGLVTEPEIEFVIEPLIVVPTGPEV